MPKYLTEFYDRSTGTVFQMRWPDERQYLLGKAFLDELTGGSVGKAANPDWPDFYILETEQQCMEMLEFRRSLREQSSDTPK